jgi:hypothetical protein
MAKIRKTSIDVAGDRRPAAARVSPHVRSAADSTRERVAFRAYELYMAHGCQDGHALDDWLEAERELLQMGTDDRIGE